jgi:hypothetical protein
MVVVGLLIGSPAGVRAELTDAERADITTLIDSATALREGERALAAAIACCSTSATRPVLANVLGRFHSAQVAHWRALANFLHTGTENPTPKPALSPLEWYTRAWFYVDLYTTRLGDLDKELTLALAYNKTDTAYQDHLRRARGTWVSRARALADEIDPAHDYLDPWPALPAGKTVHTVLGSHGDYRQMQWLINRGKNYAMDTYTALLTAYRGGADSATVRDAWVQSSQMLSTLDHASGLLADVTFSDDEAGEDRFCRTLRVTKLLTVTAAQHYEGWGDAVARLLPAPYGVVFAKLVDGWKHALDLSSWNVLVFPESTRCAAEFLRH